MSFPRRKNVKNQAFAIGFFGFHYIRAVNENQVQLQRESLEILRQLASNLNAGAAGKLYVTKKQSYHDYWNRTLQKFALILGDSHGEEIQYGISLSFELAAIYAYLYGVMTESRPRKVNACLSILQARMSSLLVSARKANITELFEPLVDLNKLLEGPKTYPTACKCMKKLKIIIKDFLWPLSESRNMTSSFITSRTLEK
jgi:hypothetical protein